MSWIPEKAPTYSLLEWAAIRLIRCGKVPNHVAFIMDGNRRFARLNKIDKIEGHTQGFDKLAEVLQWCNDLGIKEVTVYAFSIENFKRSESEVSSLMDLASQKFRRILDERARLASHGVRVRVLGDLNRLPEDLRALIAQAQEATVANKLRTLNVAFSYTSREELAQAIRATSTGVGRGFLQPGDIDEALLERCLYTGASEPVDLLIRTSGEVRLSDFLLWQSSYSTLYFAKVLWPNFSVRQLLTAVFQYQTQTFKGLLSASPVPDPPSSGRDQSKRRSRDREERISRFLQWLEDKRTEEDEKVLEGTDKSSGYGSS